MRPATFAFGSIEITPGHFATEAEAAAEIEAMGWRTAALDRITTEDEELHWHDFEAVTFVVSGILRVADADGLITEYEPGTRIRTGAGVLHREVAGAAHRLVFGFAINPNEFTEPLNKPPALLESARP
jgi:redox-sensitive bicupin YhaK (pirin superfamily)